LNATPAGEAILPAQPGTGPREYLTPAQLADLLQVDRSTVSRWAASDPSMPVIRIHGVVRFHRDQVDLWLAGKTQSQGGRRTQRRARAAQPCDIAGSAH